MFLRNKLSVIDIDWAKYFVLYVCAAVGRLLSMTVLTLSIKFSMVPIGFPIRKWTLITMTPREIADQYVNDIESI